MNESSSLTANPTIFFQLQEEERQRVANLLLSGPGQLLANTLTEIEYALPLLEKNPHVVRGGLEALRLELRDGLAQLKELVAELQPPLLDELGLGASIEQYGAKFGARVGLRIECDGCQEFHTRYPRSIELALFRVVQEALANVDAHAKATRVVIHLTGEPNQVRLEIQDNGRGFAPRAPRSAKKRQLGLITMRDRVELLGGQLKLFSEPGRGVRVLVTIPYHGYVNEFTLQGGHVANERTKRQSAPRARPSHTRQQETARTNHRAAAQEPPQKNSAPKTRAAARRRTR
ncbi:MAG: hypothetical protein HDKAJFGB_03345 [Anaerolineae bacterium]|nr:hypothetical protein [Anaerolineae bacterium]